MLLGEVARAASSLQHSFACWSTWAIEIATTKTVVSTEEIIIKTDLQGTEIASAAVIMTEAEMTEDLAALVDYM